MSHAFVIKALRGPKKQEREEPENIGFIVPAGTKIVVSVRVADVIDAGARFLVLIILLLLISLVWLSGGSGEYGDSNISNKNDNSDIGDTGGSLHGGSLSISNNFSCFSCSSHRYGI